MQQQLEMMNKRFREVMNEINGLRTVVASLRDGLVRRYFKGRRPARRAISPPHESITKNTDEKADDFDHEHGATFWLHMTCRHKGDRPHDY
jgi:hypothetical protein